MNQQIKLLMGQSLDEKFAGTWSVMDLQDLEKFADRFAELIVQECAVVADRFSDGVVGTQWGDMMFCYTVDIGKEVIDYFGVES